MTLKEKFHQWLKTEPFSSKERPTLREAQCEQIADDYAIEFAYWCEWGNTERVIHTYEELLEIFKKEKGYEDNRHNRNFKKRQHILPMGLTKT